MFCHWCFAPVPQTLLAQKYGTRPLPPHIPQAEFESLLDAVATDDDRTLLTNWFVLDENAVPAHYRLQPIESKLPYYWDDSEPEKQKEVRVCGRCGCVCEGVCVRVGWEWGFEPG
jgi:hypothetical protein